MDIPHSLSSKRYIDKTKLFWDPLGEEIYPGKFAIENTKLQKKYAYYQKHPRAPLRNLLLFLIPALFFGFFIFESFHELINENNDIGNGLIPSFFPAIIYYWHIRRLQIDLVKLFLADTFGWVYSSQKNKSRWKTLKQRFSEIFEKGNRNQYIEDEFWGTFQQVPFWIALFHYEKATGSGKHKHVVKTNKTVFSLRLRKSISTSFYIQKDSGIRFFKFFKKQSLETESSEFNKKFDVYYNKKQVKTPREILEVLTPAVQIKLLELVRANGKCEVLFRDDMVFFVFDGSALKKMKTNFFRKVEVAQKDQEFLMHRFQSILDITDDIVPYLD